MQQDKSSQGIVLDENSQEQPKAKERTKTAHKTEPGHMPQQPVEKDERASALEGKERLLGLRGRKMISGKARNQMPLGSGSWAWSTGGIVIGQRPKRGYGSCRPMTFDEDKPMKRFIAVTAFSLMCGSAFAQNAGPAPQSGMEKPGMTNGAKTDGSMDTTGMSIAKGNMKRRKAALHAEARRMTRRSKPAGF